MRVLFSILFLTSLCLLPETSYCQPKNDIYEGHEVKLKRRYFPNDQTEVMYLKKANKKILHGKYELSDKLNGILVEGFYRENKKSGIWSFYEKGTVLQKYDYDQEKFTYIRPASKNATFDVFENGEFIKSNIDYEANILGGKENIKELILRKLVMPELTATGEDTKLFYFVKITVGKTGKVEDISLDMVNGHPDMTKALEKATVYIKAVKFYPGQKDGQPIKMKTLIPVDIPVKRFVKDFNGPVYKSSN